MSTMSASVAIHEPRAEEMSLRTHEGQRLLVLTLSRGMVWFGFALDGTTTALRADAEAMDRLAELAGQAATRIRAAANGPAAAPKPDTVERNAVEPGR